MDEFLRQLERKASQGCEVATQRVQRERCRAGHTWQTVSGLDLPTGEHVLLDVCTLCGARSPTGAYSRVDLCQSNTRPRPPS